MPQGFILHILVNDRIIIFDEQYGKYQLKLPRNMYTGLMIGALISYSSIMRKKNLFLHNADMIQVPLALARHDITFLYQVIDLCLICTPTGIPMSEMFILLDYIFAIKYPIFSIAIKKRILLKILWMCGIYVDGMLHHPDMIDYLHSESLEDILKENYTIGDALLQQWLQACLVHIKNVNIWE